MSIRRGVVFLTGLFIVSAAQAGGAKQLFVLEGYESASQPRLISQGRYEELIEQSAPGGRRDRGGAVLAATNLCVAQIKTGRLEAARGSCNAAIASARGYRRSASMPGPDNERWLAIARAYSNRAVLNWASGDRAAAQADLARAAQYAPRAHFVSRNVLALSERGEAGGALAAAAER